MRRRLNLAGKTPPSSPPGPPSSAPGNVSIHLLPPARRSSRRSRYHPNTAAPTSAPSRPIGIRASPDRHRPPSSPPFVAAQLPPLSNTLVRRRGYGAGARPSFGSSESRRPGRYGGTCTLPVRR
ncbi:uncharacterized protein A4U43_C04F29430 [Asparagus officinalis]|uniref:Uncharacterized protein n=1 Tax=Asparagus officinalis TaxID=4686 RepID=A0A5P1F597_ASPOF|nr:uncharacterized protein A4U43_C04F29430 [Asparagus officinalis]